MPASSRQPSKPSVLPARPTLRGARAGLQLGLVPSAPACPRLSVGAVWSLTCVLSLLAAELRHQAHVSRAHGVGTGCILRGQTWSHVMSTGVTGEPHCVQDAVCSLTCTFSSGTCRSFGAPPPGLLITPCWSRRTGVLPPSPFQPQSSKPWGGALATGVLPEPPRSSLSPGGAAVLGVAAPSGCVAVHP